MQQHILGHPIERIIDFDRPEPLGIKAQHLFVRQILRIKRPLPLFVRVATGPNVKAHISPSYTSVVYFVVHFVGISFPIHSLATSSNSPSTSASFRPLRA